MVTRSLTEGIDVADGKLVIHNHTNHDPAVVEHMSRASPGSLPTELDRCLGIGARALAAASPLLDATMVRHEFSGVSAELRAVVDEAKEKLPQEVLGALQPLVGDNGFLPKALMNAQNRIEQELRKYFDEESAKSIAKTVEKALNDSFRESERKVERAVREALDTTDETRGLGKILSVIRKRSDESGAKLTDLVGKVAALMERREGRESSVLKGADFESALMEELSKLASVHGDAAEPTGTVQGDGGRKRGDVVITLCDEGTGEQASRIVFEAMDRAAGSQRSVLKELAEAKENRSAQVAVAVLASANVPASLGQPLQKHTGGRFICVLDKDVWDTLPLKVAYWAARVEALKLLRSTTIGELDLESATRLVDDAIAGVADLNRLRLKLGASRSSIDGAESVLNDVEAKLRGSLARLALLLKPGGA